MLMGIGDVLSGVVCPFWKHLRPIYWAYQRVHQGWSDQDVWNLDHYIQGILATSLIRLRDTTHGSPCDDVPVDDNPILNHTCHERWEKELTKAAALFQRLSDGDYEDYKDEENDYQESMRWLIKRGRDLYD